MVIKDKIYGSIVIDYQLIEELIKTKEFQRLKHIKQLGPAIKNIFPSAEHTRFQHSIGVYHIATLFLENKHLDFSSNLEKKATLIACLLHDIGHGAFSHSIEETTNYFHEEKSIWIIKNKTSKINELLFEEDPSLPEMVCKIISEKYHKKWLSQIVTSQIDADRMDYLLRDTISIDEEIMPFSISNIVNSARIIDNELAFHSNSLHEIERVLISRYHLFSRVYFSSESVKFDTFLGAIIKIIKDLIIEKKILPDENVFTKIITGSEITMHDFLKFTDKNTQKIIHSYIPFSKNIEIFYKIIFELQSIEFEEFFNEKQLLEIKKIAKQNNKNYFVSRYDNKIYNNIRSKTVWITGFRKSIDKRRNLVTVSKLISKDASEQKHNKNYIFIY